MHRVLAIVATVAVLWLYVWAIRARVPSRVKRWILAAVGLVLVQVALGVVSVLTILAVPPVSLHTLVAAALLSLLVGLATVGTRAAAPVEQPQLVETR